MIPDVKTKKGLADRIVQKLARDGAMMRVEIVRVMGVQERWVWEALDTLIKAGLVRGDFVEGDMHYRATADGDKYAVALEQQEAGR